MTSKFCKRFIEFYVFVIREIVTKIMGVEFVG